MHENTHATTTQKLTKCKRSCKCVQVTLYLPNLRRKMYIQNTSALPNDDDVSYNTLAHQKNTKKNTKIHSGSSVREQQMPKAWHRRGGLMTIKTTIVRAMRIPPLTSSTKPKNGTRRTFDENVKEMMRGNTHHCCHGDNNTETVNEQKEIDEQIGDCMEEN